MGNLDYSTLISVRVSETAALSYPISITEDAARGNGFRARGVAPDIHIPFTPGECREDLILRAAMEG